MKKIIILLSLILSYNLLAQTNRWQQKVPGRNYTYEEIIFNRGMVQKQRQLEQKLNSPEKLKGQGIEFQGVVDITTVDGISQHKVFIRSCGKIDLPKKDEKIMQQLKSGSRVKLKFDGSRSCEISDWEKF